MTQIGCMRARTATLAIAAFLALAAEATGQDADAARALDRYDPSLEPVEGLALRGDFDGDGDSDLALVATDGSRRSLVVLQADAGDWRAHPLYARLPDGPIDLRMVRPGAHRVLGGQGLVELANPGVELVFPGRSSALYVYERGRWQVYGTESY